jgi:tRNA uridine 5-carboxymethylaminomethyl modification enzyme
VIEQVEIEIKYAGYIDRQDIEISKFKSMEQKQIPLWLDYSIIPSLRTEARQKLQQIRPATVGQASRISGVSPADISLVLIWMKRGPQNPVGTS